MMSFLLHSCGSGYFHVRYVVQFFRLQVLCKLHDNSNGLGRYQNGFRRGRVTEIFVCTFVCIKQITL
jgi:hypothetical protein